MDDERLPLPLRVAASVAWRFLVIAAAVLVLALALGRLRVVILPVVVAVLLATLGAPAVARLRRIGWPDGLAALAVVGGALLALALLIGALVPISAGQFDELGGIGDQVQAGVDRAADWLVDGPLDLSEQQVDNAVQRARDELEQNATRIVGGAFSGALILVEVVIGSLLALVLLFFFLKDGDRMWAWFRDLAPREHRGTVEEAGQRAWTALSGYLRAQVVVALVDALLIGLALVVLQVPLAVPLAVLIFFGAFIPIVGAFVTGFVAVMIALASQGFVVALVVLGANVGVQQLEGNVLAPLLVGRSVHLHPVAVLIAVTAGGTIWGIPGAFVAVPVTAVVYSVASYSRERIEADAEARSAGADQPRREPLPGRAET